MMHIFQIPGPSCPQGSARAFVVAGKARITSANKGLAEWRSHAVRCIHDQIGKEPAWEPLTGALHVTVKDYRIRPKSRSKKLLWADRQPDLDKIVRACGDALEAAGVMHSDAQICSISATKSYCNVAMVEIAVWRLPE